MGWDKESVRAGFFEISKFSMPAIGATGETCQIDRRGLKKQEA
jgi:hypothetical protein